MQKRNLGNRIMHESGQDQGENGGNNDESDKNSTAYA